MLAPDELWGFLGDYFGILRPLSSPVLRPGLRQYASRFIGRSEEINAIRVLMARNRLVTLVGPPGAGKTRLAVELGHLLEGFPDGVCLMDGFQRLDVCRHGGLPLSFACERDRSDQILEARAKRLDKV